MRGIVRVLVSVAAAGLAASAASATDFSFVGTFAKGNDKAGFNFSVGTGSTVTLRSYSYAGGTNAAGQAIDRGGFDPILSLYNADTGLRIAQNDDGGNNVPADTNGARFDVFLQSLLAPGNYVVYVTQFDNFGPDNLSNPFPEDNNPDFRPTFNGRDGHWAFDVLNVDRAIQTGSVPEAATWAMMLAGFGLVGGALRRRAPRAAVSFG